jgi:hypothetical protein
MPVEVIGAADRKIQDICPDLLSTFLNAVCLQTAHGIEKKVYAVMVTGPLEKQLLRGASGGILDRCVRSMHWLGVEQ